MPSEISGSHTAVIAIVATVKFILGIASILGGVLLVGFNTTGVQNATQHAKNLPIDASFLTGGIIPLVVITPQAIVLPAIIGIIAASARKRCGYVAYLIFSLLSTLWIPVQTGVSILFACCYGLIYATHYNDSERDLAERLMGIFFCLIGFFVVNLIAWFLMFIACIVSCCNTCCYTHPSWSDEHVPILVATGAGGLSDHEPPPYLTAFPAGHQTGYALLVTRAPSTRVQQEARIPPASATQPLQEAVSLQQSATGAPPTYTHSALQHQQRSEAAGAAAAGTATVAVQQQQSDVNLMRFDE